MIEATTCEIKAATSDASAAESVADVFDGVVEDVFECYLFLRIGIHFFFKKSLLENYGELFESFKNFVLNFNFHFNFMEYQFTMCLKAIQINLF